MVIPTQSMEEHDFMDQWAFGDVDGCFYDSSTLSNDIWKKFDLDSKVDSYPTPPSSPSHEPFIDSDESLSQTFMSELPLTLNLEFDTLKCNLIQDCMWSAPGLVAAGLLPGESVKPKLDTSVDENSNTIVHSKKQNLDINSKDCVDPAAVFPCSSRNSSPTPSLSNVVPDSYNLGLDTPSASSENESDDEEIDVVTVNTDRHQQHNRSQYSGRPLKRPASLALTSIHPIKKEATLPAATSMYAQVAAMHNYSSATSQPKSSSFKSHHSYSAPQTPSSNHAGHKRLRPYSSPGSPQYSKKQKMVVSENDLKTVVRKLTGRKSHHHSHSQHSSRSSSDYEDNSEIGKRAYHNVLERKRRDDLRTSFHLLRSKVPEIASNERAPKMVILNKSMEYITELTQSHQSFVQELQRQKQIHEQLKKRLTILQRDAL